MKEVFLRALRKLSISIEQHILMSGSKKTAGNDLGCGGSNRCQNLDVTTCYFATNGAADFGDLDERTGIGTNDTVCGYGCRTHRDRPEHWLLYGVITYGKRFLPYFDNQYFEQQDGSRIYRQRRDAAGRLHDLRHNQPWLYPSDAHWLLMPIFRNDEGKECPLGDACDFDDVTWPSIYSIGGFCGNGTPEFGSMLAYYADSFFYVGSDLPKSSTSSMQCRSMFQTREIKIIPMEREFLYQTTFMRSGGPASNRRPGDANLDDDYRDGSTHHMISNMLIPATSKVVIDGNACESSYGHDVTRIENNHEWYNPHQNRQRFNYMHVTGVPRMKDTSTGIDKLKNAVLNHVATRDLPDATPTQPTRLGNLSQVDRGTVMHYLRDVNWQNYTPLNGLAKVANLDLRARLHFKRTPVQVDLVIKRAKLDVSIIAHKVLITHPPNANAEDPKIQPHCRARYFVTLGIRSTMPPVTMFQPWLKEDNPDREVTLTMPTDRDIYEDPLPTIEPDKDWLDYFVVENGKEYPVMIPAEVEWWGCLNSFSNPKVPSITLNYVPPSSTLEGYKDLADKMVNIFVPGWPTTLSNIDPNTVYSGGIRLSFPVS